MSHGLNNKRCLPKLFIRNLESAVSSSISSQLRLVKMVKVSTWWPLISEGQNLHPKNILMPLFSEHVSHEEVWGLAVQWWLPLLSCLQFPHAPATSDLSHNYPKCLVFGEVEYEICSPISSLGGLENKPFLCQTSLGLLHVRQTWFGNTIKSKTVLFLSRSRKLGERR